MYKIGEFSTLAKTTIKTLRYYEKESLIGSKLNNYMLYYLLKRLK